MTERKKIDHGLETARGGGFRIMEDLYEDLLEEQGKTRPPKGYKYDREANYDYGRTKLAWGVVATDLKRLQPNTVLTVYHGTSLYYVKDFLNGFDANRIKTRHYGGPRHAGLFVAPDIYTADRFASRGEIIIEIKVKAKNLHPVDWSGNIRKEDPGIYGEMYPDSFNPQLTQGLLDKGEPQALLRGLVKPNQITRVRYKPTNGSAQWYSRKKFIDLGLAEPAPYYQKYPNQPFRDLGWDLSSPNYTVDEFFEMMAASYDMKVDRVKSTVLRILNNPASFERGIKRIEDMADEAGFGPIAVRSFVHKIRAQYSQQKAASITLPPSGFLEGSKIKDYLFHGSNTRLDVGHSLRPDLGGEFGIYLTPKRRYARMYGTHVYEVLARVRAPKIVSGKYEISPADLTKTDIQELQRQGFDSIISKTGARIDEIVLFDRLQAWVVDRKTAYDYHRINP